MADPKWKLLTPIWGDAVTRLCCLMGGHLLDCLLSEVILTHEQYSSLLNSLRKKEAVDDVARDLLLILVKTPPPTFDKFHALLDTKIDRGKDFLRLFERSNEPPGLPEAAALQSDVTVDQRQAEEGGIHDTPPQSESGLAARACENISIFVEVADSLREEYESHKPEVTAGMQKYLAQVYPGKTIELDDIFPSTLSWRKRQREERTTFYLGSRPKIRILFPRKAEGLKKPSSVEADHRRLVTTATPSSLSKIQFHSESSQVNLHSERILIVIDVDESLMGDYQLHERAIKNYVRKNLEHVYPGKEIEVGDNVTELAWRKESMEKRRATTFAFGSRPKMRILFPRSNSTSFYHNRENIVTYICRLMRLKKDEFEDDVTEGSITLHVPDRGLIKLYHLEQNAESLKFQLDVDALAKSSFGKFPFDDARIRRAVLRCMEKDIFRNLSITKG